MKIGETLIAETASNHQKGVLSLGNHTISSVMLGKIEEEGRPDSLNLRQTKIIPSSLLVLMVLQFAEGETNYM